jgi:hypothetical protein
MRGTSPLPRSAIRGARRSLAKLHKQLPTKLATLADQQLRTAADQSPDALGVWTDLNLGLQAAPRTCPRRIAPHRRAISTRLIKEMARLIGEHQAAVQRLAEVQTLGFSPATFPRGRVTHPRDAFWQPIRRNLRLPAHLTPYSHWDTRSLSAIIAKAKTCEILGKSVACR